MKILKAAVKSILSKLGFTIMKNPKWGSIYDYLKTDLILDVGANTGQFAIKTFKSGYKGKVISFEPLLVAHSELLENSESNSKWEIYSRSALGDVDGSAELNVSNNSYSSSLLLMKESHWLAAPDSKTVGHELVEIHKLDTVFETLKGNSVSIFLKIDAQGFERNILLGGIVSLSEIRGLRVELSLELLYEEQPLYNEMIEFLDSHGFALWDIEPGFRDQATGRLLQFDGVFIRKSES